MITSKMRTLTVGAILAGSLLATACGSDDETDSSPSTTVSNAPTTGSSASTAPSESSEPETTDGASTTAPADTPATTADTGTTAPSDVGAGKTIKVGGIFARTVTPDLDLGAYEAVDAFFQELNAQGGVNGYMFSFEGIDDQGDPAKFAAAVDRLVESGVDVIISSAQTQVPGGLAQIEESGVPYIGGNAHGRDILETPNVFPTGANLQNGIGKVIETLLSSKTPPATTASLTGANHPALTGPMTVIAEDLAEAGITVEQTGSFELTETDFTGIASQIIDTGVADAIVFALNSQQPPIVGALEQQGYEGSIYGGSYDATLPSKLGSYADDRFFSVQPWGALGAGAAGDDAQAIVAKYYPDVDLMANRKAMDAWTSAEIFVEGLRQLGGDELTDESLIAALNTLTGFESTFMAPITYAAGPEGHLDVSNCMQALKINGGQWVIANDDRFTCWEGSVAPS
jgi:ABC-type branched-subunit amino acid transport system substrate-binding protein